VEQIKIVFKRKSWFWEKNWHHAWETKLQTIQDSTQAIIQLGKPRKNSACFVSKTWVQSWTILLWT